MQVFFKKNTNNLEKIFKKLMIEFVPFCFLIIMEK